MTQVFDPEDGHVERVTVIEAGPCFVTGDPHGPSATATTPSSSPSARRPRSASPSPSSACSRRPGVGNLRHLREFRGEPGELEVGDEVKVDAVFERGQTRQGLGRLEGQGLRGHDQAPQLPPRPGLARLAQRARARARSAPPPTPRACSRASAARARWATSASPSAGSRSSTCAPSENLLLVRGSVPGPQGRRRRDAERGLMAAAQVHRRRRPARSTLDDAVFGERFHGPLVHEAVRAELAARRRGTASTKTRGEVAMTGAKAWRQKGTGRARVGALSHAQPRRRRRGLRPQAAQLHRQGQPQGAPRARCAPRCRCTPSAARSPWSTRPSSTALDQGGRGGAGRARRRAAACSWC